MIKLVSLDFWTFSFERMWPLGYAFMTGKMCLRDSLRGFFGLNRYVPILLEIPYFFIYEKWFKAFSVNAYFILKKLSNTEVYMLL